MTKTNIAYMLRGCEAGRIQTVGLMQVIPLVTSPEFCSDDFVSPAGSARVDTRDYGSLGVKNTSDKTLIVPAHSAYIVKQAAQDHAMRGCGVVKKGQHRQFNDSMCIQETQGGLITSGEHEMKLLPLPLRFPAMDRTGGYSRLWSHIRKFRDSMGIPGSGNLVDFMTKFEKQLDEFVAEFECVPNQVGAIVLVNDKVVGVERTPNYEYWTDVWPHLIRECYGSFTLQVQRKLGAEKALQPLSTRLPLPEAISSLEDLEQKLHKVIEEEDAKVRDIVNSVVSEDMTLTTEESPLTGLTVDSLEHSVFRGQLIRRGEAVVYGSVILSEDERNKMTWKRARSFSM